MSKAKKHRLLVAESDPMLPEIIADYFACSRRVELCGITEDGAKALELIRSTQPDVVLLEVSLPNMDAFSIMKCLPRNNDILQPPVIVTSLYQQNGILARALGASNFLQKPNFNLEVLEEMVCLAAEPPISARIQDFTIKVKELLNQMGMPTHRIGYQYILRAAELMHDEKNAALLNKEIYNILSEDFGTNTRSVETAIRNVIKVTDTSLLGLGENPTCRKLLTKLVEYIDLHN